MKMRHSAVIAGLLMLLSAAQAQAESATAADTIDTRMAGGRHAEKPAKTAVKPASAPVSGAAGAAMGAPVEALSGGIAAPPESDIAPPLPEIAWTTPEPDDVKGKTGILSSDSGDYQYEALAPGADKAMLPEPILPAHMADRKPMIAIVIDDMGVDRKHSARAVKLPPAVTLSYLPYSADIKGQTDTAKKEGHELLVHMPMQPDRKSADPGPEALTTDLSPLELHERIGKNLGAFTGYIGINNHMGSKFTCDREGLNVVMAALEEKKLMFLDSRTSPKTVAEDAARAHHLKTSHRDVFIDNDESAPAVEKSLAQIERVAKHAGAAIAIGHPKDVTLDALEKWLPGLKAKGFDLVPLSDVINLRNAPKPPAVASAVKVEVKAAAPVKPALEKPSEPVKKAE